jgi:hypothetical protein
MRSNAVLHFSERPQDGRLVGSVRHTIPVPPPRGWCFKTPWPMLDSGVVVSLSPGGAAVRSQGARAPGKPRRPLLPPAPKGRQSLQITVESGFYCRPSGAGWAFEARRSRSRGSRPLTMDCRPSGAQDGEHPETQHEPFLRRTEGGSLHKSTTEGPKARHRVGRSILDEPSGFPSPSTIPATEAAS